MAVLLGPTNTGKTHRAVERMLEHDSGIIGLPLRLLAREIYDRVSARVGEDQVALVTGEEKRLPRGARYFVCTTEAMPRREVDFVAVDEVQLATHDERGHVFTERILDARGRRETWLLGAPTMRPLLSQLVPTARSEDHVRLSRLSFAGSAKLQRLPPRSAVVAFSIAEVYALAERLRALRGGAAIVLGALSPRARNAQVAMFQAGEVDWLVATDAIGMGLNLDVRHVAFAALRKFDGHAPRALDDAEIGQIAGRAGRYVTDGTFGTVAPLELPRDVAQRVEAHRFAAVRRVRWRSTELDFSSFEALTVSLRTPPSRACLSPVPAAEDLRSLHALSRDPDVRAALQGEEGVRLLWEVCRIPDFRKLLFEAHVALQRDLALELARGPLRDDWFAAQIADVDDLSGDVDTLVARMARLRTWAFVAHQSRWFRSADHWQERLRDLEDRLSDALHAALVARFVSSRPRSPRPVHPPRRPAPRAPRPSSEVPFDVDPAHPFAALLAVRPALAAPALQRPLHPLEALVDAPHEAFRVDASGCISAADQPLATLVGGPAIGRPDVRLLPLDGAGPGLRAQLHRRLLAFARDVVGRLLGPIASLAQEATPAVRAIGYHLEQGLGTARRAELADLLGQLDDTARDRLRRAGVHAGGLVVHVPALQRGDALRTRAALVRAHRGRSPVVGAPSLPAGEADDRAWLALGYVVLGTRAVRADLAERLAAESDLEPGRVQRVLGVRRGEALRLAPLLKAS